MSWDDERLTQLLRTLSPAPEHLVERAKDLPSHMGEPPPDAGGEGESDDVDVPAPDDPAPAGHYEFDPLVAPTDHDDPDHDQGSDDVGV